MALLKTDSNLYIKIYPNKTYEVYKSLEDRLKVKNATSKDIILNRYNTLLTQYRDNLDTALSSKNIRSEEQFQAELKSNNTLKDTYNYFLAITNEYSQYLYCLKNKIKSGHFPIMQEIYSDIDNTIPSIIEAGTLALDGNTQRDLYNDAKLKKRFGQTSDV